MADLRIHFSGLGPELNLMVNDLELDNGIHTSVLLSILTDLSEDGGAGWWGDTIEGEETPIGSRAWLIDKNGQGDRNKLKKYIEQSLSWMVSEGIAEKIAVQIESTQAQRMAYKVVITQPKGDDSAFIYSVNWDFTKIFVERVENAN